MTNPIPAPSPRPTLRHAIRAALGKLHVREDFAPPPRASQPDEEPAPLSFAQQRLWFLQQMEPSSPVYNMAFAFHLGGRLNIRALQNAIAAFVARHDALRAAFRILDGRPAQVFHAPGALELPVCPAADVNLAPPGLAIPQVVTDLARQPFDLEKGPLYRFRLFRTGPDEQWLSVNIHHIACDAWSMGLFCREISEDYHASLHADAPPSRPPPVRYADFARWQTRGLEQDAFAEHLAWWKRQLAGDCAPLDLPLDRPRSMHPGFHGGREFIAIPADLTARLKALSQQNGCTLFMTLLAAFDVLLHRYSRQTDIWVGTPVSIRNQPKLEGAAGLFINTLALRADLSGNPSFLELLRRVREISLGSFERSSLPFERLVEEIRPDRMGARNPFFQVMFSLQNTPPHPLRLDGLEVSAFEVDTASAKFDLTLGVIENGGLLRAGMEYSASVFDPATIRRMLGHWRNLLTVFATAPETAIARAPMLANSERLELLGGWNSHRADYPSDDCLHQLFEAQAKRTPDAVALVYGQQFLTYDELNRRADAVAAALVQRGVGPDSLVGLRLDRCPEAIVGMLGILKAGGAYVPLDPSWPGDRLRLVVEDASLSLVVTSHDLAADPLPNLVAILRVPGLDEGAWSGLEAAVNPPVSRSSPDQLAYVIYTSGSTGTPKGALVTHRNVVRLFAATRDFFNFDASDTWTLFHSMAFDFSVWEIWGPLLLGGRLVIVPHWLSRSPSDFLRLLLDEKVTVLNQTPSAFRLLIGEETARHERLSTCLRWIIFGGEALDPSSLRPWFSRHGDEKPRLVNMYGITETTVHVTFRRVHADECFPGSLIGRPVNDMALYVLDEFGEPVPLGVTGELVVGGAGVARGYLNRPELTASRFIPNPFNNAGGRLYRSGDLARRLANGELEYLGREDGQMKIRGFRIELGEVQAVLLRHPGVQEAVVVPVDDQARGKSIAAYVKPAPGASLNAAELSGFLAARLPDYMRPSALMIIPSIPLTSNGKVDRRALPPADSTRHTLAVPFKPPTTPTEDAIAQIWRELLGLDRVGVDDSFFDLGGHSLLMVRMLARIHDAFQVEVSLPLAFASATISAIATAVEEQLIEQIDELSESEAECRMGESRSASHN